MSWPLLFGPSPRHRYPRIRLFLLLKSPLGPLSRSILWSPLLPMCLASVPVVLGFRKSRLISFSNSKPFGTFADGV
eukprot:11719508-Prorocentrum_lima.AAC.1